MKSLLQKLTQTPGPSGYEHQIRDVVENEIKDLADAYWIDNLGNLIARKGSEGPKVMLAAHIDELGVMVTHIDEKGFVRFLPVGTVYPRTCLGGRVRFLNGMTGVIGAERQEDINRVPSFDQLFIDVGVSSRDECPLQVGDVGVFDRQFEDLGRRVTSKALDNRIGVTVLIETLRKIAAENIQIPQQVFFVFSVQEEVGVRGAPAAAFDISPDLGLAVDVTGSGDTPNGSRLEISLGKGPAIKVRDQGMLSDPRVVQWMVQTAEQHGLPYQLEVLPRGGTDARGIQVSRSGVPAGGLVIPCRYVHSPSELADIEDAQNAVRLLVELLRSPFNPEGTGERSG